ncbi:unnamed protein product, partial [Ectocarpus sp. 8 AP-2014]
LFHGLDDEILAGSRCVEEVRPCRAAEEVAYGREQTTAATVASWRRLSSVRLATFSRSSSCCCCILRIATILAAAVVVAAATAAASVAGTLVVARADATAGGSTSALFF